jgi:thiol-disulfide isomerase/thioredoxin
MVALHAALVLLAVSSTGQTVLLDFRADWCGPCRGMDPTVHALAEKGYPVQAVNVDQQRDLAARFHVQTIPCFVMLVNGQEVDRVVGSTSIERLQQMLSLAQQAAPVAAPAMTAATAVPPRSLAPRAQPMVGDAQLLAASVRLRIEDAEGHSCGSGTIIDARPGGEALILTCGHIFRDSKGRGKIEVDLFGPAPGTRLPGRVLAYDLKRDVGLVAIQPPGPVTVARVAPPGYTIRSGDAVASVGCDNGDNPTVQRSRINSLDRFLGPPNLQVAGQPIVGRSGGGLFSSEGLVIGVCNAADPTDREGLFAALGSIHSELDELGISSVYRHDAAPETPGNETVATAAPQPAAAAVDPFSPERLQSPPRVRMPSPDPNVRPVSNETVVAVPLVADEQAALEEIRRRVKEGAEVVCIVRDRHDTQSQSQVITLDHASGAFVRELINDTRPTDTRHETSLEVPKARTPILEWDAQQGWRHREPLGQ